MCYRFEMSPGVGDHAGVVPQKSTGNVKRKTSLRLAILADHDPQDVVPARPKVINVALPERKAA